MAKTNVGYVDGFVFSVPRKNLKAYQKMASAAGKIWMKHGALYYIESVGDDVRPKDVKFFFPKMAQTKAGEVVCFSYIAYKSKAHRDAVNKKTMQDPAMEKMIFDFPVKFIVKSGQHKGIPMPFDMQRFAYGGFKTIVSQ